ncbi:MAG TPA: DeoR family transcriptional regulator [Dehalococcoidia bacterium]|nr:DeoR family transcriptional regulator [Dehalococcoidia bacterium]
MQTTKHQILVLLKRTGSVTIDEAAGALAVASMTARQHLTGLERDGLVRTEKAKRHTGRPHFVFSLTPKGEEMFPRRFDLFAQALLEEASNLTPTDIESLDPESQRSLLIQRSADRLAERFRFQVTGKTLGQRVAAVSDVLHLIGGFAEWLQIEDGFEIRDYNCVFAKLVAEQQSGCEWHERLLTQLLNWPVRHELMLNGSAGCCRYLISSQPDLSAEGSTAEFHNKEGLLSNG